jgi:hypothetical protein
MLSIEAYQTPFNTNTKYIVAEKTSRKAVRVPLYQRNWVPGCHGRVDINTLLPVRYRKAEWNGA